HDDIGAAAGAQVMVDRHRAPRARGEPFGRVPGPGAPNPLRRGLDETADAEFVKLAHGSASADLGGEAFRTLRSGFRVHPHDLPDVAVGVGVAATVHEAVVLFGAGVGLAAGLGRAFDHGVDGRAAVLGQAKQHLGRLVRVGDGAVGEGCPLLMGQQHDVDGLGKDHAG
uniref:NADH-quinone oxidoreductase subunit J n=1 Tax=Parastrongyloides trichosuri TaxID=131310 RepID=A0A0N5A4D0_PARTI